MREYPWLGRNGEYGVPLGQDKQPPGLRRGSFPGAWLWVLEQFIS